MQVKSSTIVTRHRMLLRTAACILLLLTMLCACHIPSAQGRLAAADSLVEQHPDTALHILQGIDYNGLDEEDKARYGLLITAAEYKLYLPVDTTFINRALYYYSTHASARTPSSLGDPRAASLYYKGAVLYDMGKKPEATLLLKQAEEAAEHSDDELLRNKIYENLERINDEAHNYPLALRYSKLFLESSLNGRDTASIVRALDHVAASYAHLGFSDSVDIIHSKVKGLLTDLPDSSKAYTMGNLAAHLVAIAKYREAKELLENAASLYPLPHHYMLRGKIAEKEKAADEAIVYYKKCLDFHHPEISVNACKRLSRIYGTKDNNRQQLRYLHLADSIQEELHQQTQTPNLTDIQYEYDKKKEKAESHRKLSAIKTTTCILAAILALLTVIVYAVANRRKREVRQHLAETMALAGEIASCRKRIGELTEKEKGLNEAISDLKQSNARLTQKADGQDWQLREFRESMGAEMARIQEEHRSEIETLRGLLDASSLERRRLRAKIDELRQAKASSLGNGRTIYEKISRRQKVGYLTKEDLSDLTDYYIMVFHEEFAPVLSCYENLSRQELVYLILCRMGADETMTAKVMGIQTATLRTYKNRLKKRMKPSTAD